MSSARERREADLFYADLFGRSPAPARWRSRGRPVESVGCPCRQESEDTNYRTGRVIFYDKETLRFIEGWTRFTSTDQVFLITRSEYDRVRADGRRRSAEQDAFLRRRIRGGAIGPDGLPLFIMDPSLHTAPLNPRSADWDDLMIDLLIDVAQPLKIEPQATQEKTMQDLFAQALLDARNKARSGVRGVSAQEFAAYFQLDTIQATLTMVAATGVTMQGNHASSPLGRLSAADRQRMRAPNRRRVPNTDAEQRVIGNVHTHVLVDPLINLTSTQTGTTVRSSTTVLHSGVSDVDVSS